MKKSILLIAVFATTMGMYGFDYNNSRDVETKGVNGGDDITVVKAEKSSIKWSGAKVVGGSHDGTINFKSTNLKFKGDNLIGGDFEVDMTSMKNTDLEGEWNQKLIGHLKSDDFFGTQQYPTSKFVITKVNETGSNKYEVTGKLTIKNTTQVETFTTVVIKKGNKMTLSADFNIDRTKYNVRYGSDSFFDDLGDKAISDDFNMKIQIETSL